MEGNGEHVDKHDVQLHRAHESSERSLGELDFGKVRARFPIITQSHLHRMTFPTAIHRLNSSATMTGAYWTSILPLVCVVDPTGYRAHVLSRSLRMNIADRMISSAASAS